MREVIPLYKSVFNGVKDLDAETFKRLMLALMEYGFEEVDPELDGLERTVFESWKANVDARFKDSDNGKKGGRPSKNPGYDINNPGYEDENPPLQDENGGSETEKHITKTKTETKNETKTKTVEKHRHGAYSHVLLTDQEYQKLVEEYGEEQAKKAVDYLDEYIERKGYTAKSHYLAIKKWVFNAIREEQIKQQEMQQREQRAENFKHPMNPPAKPQQGIQREEDLDAMLLNQIIGRGQNNDHMDNMPQERTAGYVPIGFGPQYAGP